MKLSKSAEDYLETIYLLEQEYESVKSVQIAEALNVSRPAVNQAMNELISLNLVTKPDYSRITLTEKGRELACETYSRHCLLKEFFLWLGVSDTTAEIDCCKIEHIISDETLSAMKRKLKK